MEEWTSHAGGASPGEGTFFCGDVDAIVLGRPEWVDADDCIEIGLGERGWWVAAGVAKGCEVVVDRACGGSTGFGVSKKWDAVGTARALDARLCRDERFDDVEMAEHCGGEDGRTSALGEEVFSNGTVAHVRCGAEGIFPIAEAPVPCGASERGMRVDELPYALEIEVGDHDHLVSELGSLRGEGGRELRAGR